MNLAQLAYRVNDLSIWKQGIHVWGYDMRACNGDRFLNLCLHRFGLMGSAPRQTFETILRPGFTAVDVGANQGLYSLLFASLVGPQGRVFSFEPDAALFAALRENCQRNRAENISSFNCAIGARAETRTLYRSRVNSGDNRLAASDWSDWFYEIDIRTETLDSVLGNAHVDFIKIDVQGWEFEVVKGMAEVWNLNPALSIYFEFWPFGLRRAACEPLQLLDYFRQHGFTLCGIVGSDARPIDNFESFCSALQGYKSTNMGSRS